MSTVIISQIRQSKNISDATQASYIAESVLEKSLYIVKEERKKSDAILDEGVQDDVIDTLSDIQLPDLDYEIIEATSEVQYTEVAVNQNETYQIDLFDTDQQEGLEDIENIFISWDNNHCSVLDPGYKDCFEEGGEWAEVTWANWGYDPWEFGVEQKQLISAPELYWSDGCPDEPIFRVREDFEEKQCYIIKVTPANRPNYRVKVRALYGGLEGLEIRALDIGKNPIAPEGNIMSWVVVKALGKAGGKISGTPGSIRQALQITAPWKVPLTGILNFTLLSEEEIDK